MSVRARRNTPRVRFFTDHIRQRGVQQPVGIALGVDPGVDGFLRQDERHPVMDGGDGFSRLARQDDEVRKVFFQAVEPAEPGDPAVPGHDGVLVPGLHFAGRGERMLPFVIPGSGNDTAMGGPALPQGGLFGGGFPGF